MLTYLEFQSLPKGIKQMLVTSENHFFGNAMAIVANKNGIWLNEVKVAQPNIFMRSLAAGRGPTFRLQTTEKPLAFQA